MVAKVVTVALGAGGASLRSMWTVSRSATIRVYFDTWKKTNDGGRKVTSTWYRLD